MTVQPVTAPPSNEPTGSPVAASMAPVLLVIAVPGLASLLRALWVCLVGDGPFHGGQDSTTRFEDRATWWVAFGPGSSSGWATLSALSAFTVVVLVRRHQHAAVSARLRRAASALSTLLFLVELSGPLSVAVGWVQLSLDPTSARSFWDDDVSASPALVLCMVLTVLAALNVRVLRSAPPTGDENPQGESATTAPGAPVADHTRDPGGTADRDGAYRRPTP